MRFRHLRRWAVLGVAAMVSALGASTVRAVTLSAGQVPSPAQVTDRDLVVPRFEIVTPSPYEISGDARPGQFFGVMSDRAAWLGLETGEAEVWIHPLKIASRLELSFSAPRFGSIPGRDIARTVVTRPRALDHPLQSLRLSAFVSTLSPATDSPGYSFSSRSTRPSPSR